MNVIEKVNQIIVEVMEKRIGINDLAPEKLLAEDIGAESMDILQIALSISAEFGIDVHSDEVTDLRTLNDIYTFVSKAKKGK